MGAPTATKPRSTVRLKPLVHRALYGIGIGTWFTGVLWLVFHRFLTRNGEFGPTPHPLEPWWLRLHGAFAFAAIWIFGYLWSIHIEVAWPYQRRRLSGSVLVAILLWLTVSGYLLYYLGDDTLRAAASLSHWVLGLTAPAGFVWHRWRRKYRLLK